MVHEEEKDEEDEKAYRKAVKRELAGCWKCNNCGDTWERVDGKRYYRVVQGPAKYEQICPDCLKDCLGAASRPHYKPSEAEIIAAEKKMDEEDAKYGDLRPHTRDEAIQNKVNQLTLKRIHARQYHARHKHEALYRERRRIARKNRKARIRELKKIRSLDLKNNKPRRKRIGEAPSSGV